MQARANRDAASHSDWRRHQGICATPLRPTGATMPNPARWARIALITAVCWRMNRWRVRCSIRPLLGAFGRNEPYVRPGHCLADCLGVSRIVLLSLDVRLHVGRRHQPHGVAERLELTRPVMRGSAGLDPNEAWLQSLEKRQHVAPLQLPADNDLARSIDAMNLENRLGDVETNRRDRLHLRLLRIVGAPTAPTSMALPCRWRSRPQHQQRPSRWEP